MSTGDPPCPHCGNYTFASDSNPTGRCTCQDSKVREAMAYYGSPPRLWGRPDGLPTIAPPLVIIESPFAGDIKGNIEYAQRAMRDSLQRGEAPFASHLLYTQPGILDDDIPRERKQGIKAGFAWRQVADLTAIYQDRGITEGMQQGIQDAVDRGCPVEYRTIGEEG